MLTARFLLHTVPLFPALVHSATLRVGPGHDLHLPSQAANLARDGDTIEIDGGDYRRDVAIWKANNLTIRAVNGMAHLRSEGLVAKGKAIWLIMGDNATVENIGFYDARSGDRNGAGIRLEGTHLTVRNCLFRANENGLLTGKNPVSEVLVEDSEFDNNGHGDGRSHNIYVGNIKKFAARNVYSHQARVGHQLKSRAQENSITGSRLEDGPLGRSSYLIDLPNGGIATIADNTLVQGPMAENSTMVSFGAEKASHPVHRLVVQNNLFQNDRPGNCILLNVRKPLTDPAEVMGNQFSGCFRMKGRIRASENRTID